MKEVDYLDGSFFSMSSGAVKFPSSVQEVADQNQLGESIKEYSPRLTMLFAVAMCGGLVFLFLVFLLMMIIINNIKENIKIPLIVFIVVLLMLVGALLLFQWRRVLIAKRRWVYLYHEGFVLSDEGVLMVFPWEQIEEIRTYSERRGIFLQAIQGIITHSKEGKITLFSPGTGDLEELLRVSIQAIAHKRIPQILQAIAAGETVSFGRISVNKEGIGGQREWVLWQDVERVSSNFIYKKGKKLPVLTFPTWPIPYQALLIPIIKHMSSGSPEDDLVDL
jgi:hypothetical protein